MLTELKNNPAIYTDLDNKTIYLKNGLNEVLQATGTPFVINQLGSMISVHFSDRPVIDFASASASDNLLFNKFFHAMLNRGIYLAPSAFETWFLCNALSTADIDRTVATAGDALKEIL